MTSEFFPRYIVLQTMLHNVEVLVHILLIYFECYKMSFLQNCKFAKISILPVDQRVFHEWH
jgi:hypothetical protein